MGTAAQDELARLEGERKDFERRISELENQATLANQVTTMAKTFIENWKGLGELLAAADGDQQREILQHFVGQTRPRGDVDDLAGPEPLEVF